MPSRAHLARSIARVEAIASLPHRPSRPQVHARAWLTRLAPTRRSFGAGLAVLALALGGYLIARETSLFAVDRIEVQGGSPQLAAQVRQALGSFVGRPLVGLDGAAVLGRVDALPTVVRASYDRAFPHTLRITVVPEQPASVLRRGPESWLVSARGRVMQRLAGGALPRLPRIWLSTHTRVQTGAEVSGAGTAVAARALGMSGAFAARVDSAAVTGGTLVFHLRSGLELVLGNAADVKLKVAVAARVLALLPSGSTFVDVSSPGRPVAGTGSPSALQPRSSSKG